MLKPKSHDTEGEKSAKWKGVERGKGGGRGRKKRGSERSSSGCSDYVFDDNQALITA